MIKTGTIVNASTSITTMIDIQNTIENLKTTWKNWTILQA